jgi:hypothetical protein
MPSSDSTRTRNAIFGCLGVTTLAFIVLYVAIQRLSRTTSDGQPCIHAAQAVEPLFVGDSTRLTIGQFEQGSTCGRRTPRGFRWASSNDAIAEVSPDGWVRGKTPGAFVAVATRRSDSLSTSGFVLPAEWKIDIEPDSATLRVGDSVAVLVRAYDKTGTPLPIVPYHLFTPEFFEGSSGKKPIVNRWSWTNALEPVQVVAIDTGTTTLIGRIGSKEVRVRLRIVR